MRLSFYLDKTAAHPLVSFEIADPATVRRRLTKAAVGCLFLWLVVMWANFFTDGRIPLFVGLLFIVAFGAFMSVVIKIDETARMEKAVSHEQRIG